MQVSLSRIHKILIGVGFTVLLVAIFVVWMIWNDLTPADFFKAPDEVLDETIYWAQEGDEEEFKRLFTKDSVKGMDEIHVWATGTLESPAASQYDPNDLLTWDRLMAEMAAQGGFTVEEEIGFEEKWMDDELTVTLKFDGGKRKAYRMVKKGGVWRIDITRDPAYGRAKTCKEREALCRRRGGNSSSLEELDALIQSAQ